jgi:ATP-dependent helicase/nuclease subunit A
MEEYNRLLYVALTRAEDRLLVCGWQAKRPADDACWYRAVERGFAALACERQAFDAWDGEVLRMRSPQLAPVQPGALGGPAGGAVALPSWIGCAPDWRAAPPPLEPPRPKPLAPSRPEGVGLGSVPAASSPLAKRDPLGLRFRRGQLVHALLQHLPSVPQLGRREAALRFAGRPGHGLDAASVDTVVAETLAVLEHADLEALFGPDGRAEVPLSGTIGDTVVGGVVDRMVVLPDRVVVADFKSNRESPEAVENTPVLYLRQLASYRALLRGVFPDRPVRCVLVWTREARVVVLPDVLLDGYAPGACAA